MEGEEQQGLERERERREEQLKDCIGLEERGPKVGAWARAESGKRGKLWGKEKEV